MTKRRVWSLLVDSQALLWWLADDERLPGSARELMADAQTTLYYSAASVWEISVKRALGRLRAPDDLPSRLEADAFRELAISASHAWLAGALAPHHHDPFDRMIVAQAQVENLPVVTNDQLIAAYGIDVAW